MPPSPSRVVAVVGTTASGKSDLAIALARRLGGEVISADSRQVYRGLDLGSGKVTAEERAVVPHHLLDVADLHASERFTVADYQPLARQAIDEILARGHLPILVGGTGLYVRAVIDAPAYPRVAPDPALRATLEAQPLATLAARLQQLDPVAAAEIDLRNPRRVVRALEVTLSTGIPFSEHRRRAAASPTRPPLDALQLGLTFPREGLKKRIEQRVDARLAATPGMLDEVRSLLAAGVPPQRLLDLGLEYRFLTRHLLGELPFDAMRRDLILAIGQFAKRQLTWFRRDARIHWLADPSNPLQEAESLVRAGAS